MRAREFIVEDNINVGAVSNLLTVLDNLRNKSQPGEQAPSIRVDSLVNMIRRVPGSEMFNVDVLMSIYDKNSAIKNLIKDIKDDASGVKHIYLKPAIGQDIDDINVAAEPEEPDTIKSPEKTVDQMSKRALKRRS